MNTEYELEYEPTIADEIFTQAKAALFAAAKKEIAEKVLAVEKENLRLQKENESLRTQLYRLEQRENSLNRREEELNKMAAVMPVEKFFGQRAVILYSVEYNRTELLPKCDKCNDKRRIAYKTPLGKDAEEQCDCDAWQYVYIPRMNTLREIRRGRDKELLMWFRRYDKNSGDGYSDGRLVGDENVYQEGQTFETLDKYSVYFRDEVKCQEYCDWLNKEK